MADFSKRSRLMSRAKSSARAATLNAASNVNMTTDHLIIGYSNQNRICHRGTETQRHREKSGGERESAGLCFALHFLCDSVSLWQIHFRTLRRRVARGF